MSNCGVCNYPIPIEHAQIIRKESDESYTFYHLKCEGRAKSIKPCPDCGYHKLKCSECAESEGETNDQKSSKEGTS